VGEDGLPCLLGKKTEAQVVPREVAEVVGGQVQKKTVPYTVFVTKLVKVPLDAKDVQVLTPDGKRVGPADVRKLLSRPVPVLVSADGNPIDPFYLQLLREGSLCVVAPELANISTKP
jgi:hypothetical protein